MKKNMGSADRIIRIVIALVLVILFANGIIPGIWGIVSLVLAGVFVLTSLVSTCPLYLPFGIRTNGLLPISSAPQLYWNKFLNRKSRVLTGSFLV